MGWILVLGLMVVCVVFGAFAIGAFRRNAALRTMAVQFGLTFSPAVPMGLQALPFPLFSRGDKQRFRNLLGGHWGGIDLQEFDLGITVSEGRSSNTTWYSCAVTQVPAWCQTLTIGAEHLVERVTGELLGHNVPFESEQFQRTFNVSCEDARFASAFVDARMMAWLLAHGRGWTFEVSGCWALCYRKIVHPQELIPLLGTLRGFSDHIPRVVSELYGGGQLPIG